MLLMIVCGVLLFGGAVLTVIWSGERLVEPPTPQVLALPRAPGSERGQRMPRHLAGLKVYVWWATVVTMLGTASCLVITGAGGRLIMRLLAETSPEATGRITEAFARVGDITVAGTIAYLVFGALPAAFASALLYLLVAAWLPPGRLGGPTYGLLLLVTVAPFLEPLRTSNVDFAIVGPGWLALLLFAALAVLQGAFLAALAGRLSRSLPSSHASAGSGRPPRSSRRSCSFRSVSCSQSVRSWHSCSRARCHGCSQPAPRGSAS